MKRVYGKTVKELIKDYVGLIDQEASPSEGGKEDAQFTRDDIHQWFMDNYPRIKRGTVNAHLIRLSTNAPSRVHHNVTAESGDDLLFQVDTQTFRPYDKRNDPQPIYKDSVPEDEEEYIPESYEFAYERDLRNYLSKNLDKIEPGLTLFEEEGLNGIEFPVGGRFIDILALDERENLVVIELKVSRGYDRVVGQILRYMGWIRENLATDGQQVRGVIVARTITEDLKLATSSIPEIALFEYELMVRLTAC